MGGSVHLPSSLPSTNLLVGLLPVEGEVGDDLGITILYLLSSAVQNETDLSYLNELHVLQNDRGNRQIIIKELTSSIPHSFLFPGVPSRSTRRRGRSHL